MTFDVAAARYWTEKGQYSKERDLTESIQRLVDWIGPRTPIVEITDNTISQLVARRRGEPRMGRPKLGLVSVATVNRSVTELLRRILTRARKIWRIPLPNEPQWPEHILGEKDERIRELGFDEEERFREFERPDYRAVRLFAQATGLRRREITSLTWAQVDWSNGVMRVVGKGDKPLVLPITPEITEILWPLRGHHETHVFTFVATRTIRNPKTGLHYIKDQRYPITAQGWASVFRRMRRDAGVGDFRLHDLRHTALTRTLRSSKNIRAVQKMAGHADIKTTMRYAHAMLDDIAEAMSSRPGDEAERRENHERRTKSREIPEQAEQISRKPLAGQAKSRTRT